jgi:excisionase family DNA binding protein
VHAATWLTVEEVARTVGVSAESIRRWAKSGRIPGARRLPTGAMRLPPDSVERLLHSLDDRSALHPSNLITPYERMRQAQQVAAQEAAQ